MTPFLKKLLAGGKPAIDTRADGDADASVSASAYIWQNADWVKGLAWQKDALAEALTETESAHKALHARIHAEISAIQDDILLRGLTAEGVATLWLADGKTDPQQLRGALMGELGVHGDGRGGRVAATPRIEYLARVLVDMVRNLDVAVSHDRLDTWHALLVRGEGEARRQDDKPLRIALPMPMTQADKDKDKDKAVEFTYQPPPLASLADLPHMVQDLLVRDDSYLIKAGLLHLLLVTLRVYADGNGRVARLAANAILLQGVHDKTSACFFSVAGEMERQATSYYQQLHAAQSGGLDVTAWLRWWLGCVGEAIRQMDEVVAAAQFKHRFWQRFAKAPFNPRQAKMLVRLLDGFDDVVSTQNWARLTKCGHDTAYHDISGLVGDGILKRAPTDGRGICYQLVQEA